MDGLDPFCSCRHVDAAVCVDAEEVTVIGGVVEPAQGQTIADLRDSRFPGVGDDVRGFQELRVRKIADCARDLVGTEYVLPEVVLVDSLLRPSGNVLLLDLARILVI